MKSNGRVLRTWFNQLHTPNSKVKFTSFLKKKVDVTPILPPTTVHSSTRTTDVTGSIELPAGTEMVKPGDTVIDVELIHPTPSNKVQHSHP